MKIKEILEGKPFEIKGKTYKWKAPIWMHIVAGVAVVGGIWCGMAFSYAVHPGIWGF